MALLATIIFTLSVLGEVLSNLEHYPTCVVIDPTSGSCLGVFLRYWEGYPSAIGNESLVHHEYVLHLEKVYDYNDVSATNCQIRKQSIYSSAFENSTWTRDGFTTCSEDDVSQFNTWWGENCEGHCTEDDNCRKYPFYLIQHLWNNCTWNARDDRPLYDIKIP
ncbi:hypothetical protein HOLleu_18714 [Holothuria leucospilota]|uniref:Secreted protein n=1 Tax=Holothuria leucospilota TaxID=206669 RepID=A0A9Q1C407_HOLLE|nr:hypothetical protein HOLleu_18714 [Holothuria leucospilota]